ncbi:HAD-like domain [Pseudocohnilembus persalinus]|uniref:HAD-like domain n=1 Tax=Pseudocohnilembus persalinus TaxID=266149 RepID=A0A0V0Q9S9_PSEPJ|nr:HAD-like domain [Pseudocohnilembus persalinus]|eukprot:KRW98968.1 HAD-like domain [Pseudocohnilembus persalinus]
MQNYLRINENILHQKQESIFNQIVLKGKVFSRCTPDLKQKIIYLLQQQGQKVAMVGDGANDCLAINQANIGISFASAEAALSSPFCTNNESIKCVEQVILEGRNTLSINYELTHAYLYMGYLRIIMHNMELFYYQYPSNLCYK